MAGSSNDGNGGDFRAGAGRCRNLDQRKTRAFCQTNPVNGFQCLFRLRQQGDKAAVPGVEFDPPWTTLSVGTVHGGTAINIIARECRIDWEFRPLPGVDAAQVVREFEAAVVPIRAAIKAAAPEGDLATRLVLGSPALKPEPNGIAEALALRLTGSNRAIAVSYGTEAGHFQQHGISTVVCGPGDIAQAHKPDEFIAPTQLGACEAFLMRLADWAAA